MASSTEPQKEEPGESWADVPPDSDVGFPEITVAKAGLVLQ